MAVIPVKTGIQKNNNGIDSRLRGNDKRKAQYDNQCNPRNLRLILYL